MRIGVDIDDTVSNSNERIIEEALIYDEKYVNGRGFKNKDGYTFMEKFYWNVYHVDDFLDKIRKGNYFLELDVKAEADKYITKLYNEGHEIYFITRRRDTLGVKMKTKKWLKNKGFKYHKIVFGIVEKGQYCKDNKIDLFIDNDYRNVERATKLGVRSLLMADDYNKDIEDCEMVHKWKEVYDIVNGVK